MKAEDILLVQSAKCLGLALIVFSVFGCGNIFSLMEAIFVLLVIDNVKDRWMTWKTPILVIYLVGLVYAIACVVSLVICFVYFTISVIDYRGVSGREAISYFFILAILGSCLTQIVFSCKVYTAYRRLNAPLAPLPAAGYNALP